MKKHLIAWADRAVNRWLSQVVELSDPPQWSLGQTQRPVRECPAIAVVGQDPSPPTPLPVRGERGRGEGFIAANCGKSGRGFENAEEFVNASESDVAERRDSFFSAAAGRRFRRV